MENTAIMLIPYYSVGIHLSLPVVVLNGFPSVNFGMQYVTPKTGLRVSLKDGTFMN